MSIIDKVLKTVLGSRKDKELKAMYVRVLDINKIYEELASVSDEELRAETRKLKEVIQKETADLREQIKESYEAHINELDSDKEDVEELRKSLFKKFR